MSVIRVEPSDALERLEVSRTRLLRAAPDLSAVRLLRGGQRVVLGTVAAALVVALVLAPMGTLIALVALCTAVYLATVAHRIAIAVRSRRADAVYVVDDAEARAIPDHELPTYTVLVPAYREPEVIDVLMDHLGALEYPADRLDLKLLLEADDTATVDRALRHPRAAAVQIVLVPPGEPRTKPKALNYGLTLATGDLVTIYDAEDEPDPLQMRRAAAAFARAPEDVACLQAQLTYRNPDQNLITRWFATEYLMWFTLFLPGLAASDAPIPLGGTSNHVRRAALEGLGGWDPFNVTEDADLGVRLHRIGWRCGVLGSVTLEEANSDFVNWMKQRSRWYKGYLQTWLVHLRHPVRLWRELGHGGFAQFNLFVGGTPLLALLNPLFWGLTALWFLARAPFIEALFPAPVYYAGLTCWAVGNLAVLYLNVLAARKAGRPSLVLAGLLVPLYWLMMSVAAVKAAVQLVFQPSYWEKTTHGLDGVGRPVPSGATAGAAGEPGGPGELGGGTVHATALDPLAASAALGAPALAAAAARGRSTVGQLVGAARALRATGLVLVALVVWLLAGTAAVAGHGAGHRAAAAQRPVVASAAAVPPTAGEPIARLHAPRSGLAVTVAEGTSASTLDRAVGHATSSALPGGAGNAVVVGHRRLAGGPLRDLGSLRVGDRLDATSRWGRAAYRVTAVERVPGGAVDLDPAGPARLTLITDAPGGDVLQVRARLVGTPDRTLPAPAAGYPALPTADAAALVGAAAWLALAALLWSGRRLLGRALPGTVAVGIGALVAGACLAQSFIAFGHGLSGLT